MRGIHSILVPTDLSDSADLALRRAIDLAARFDARLDVLHVVYDYRSPYVPRLTETEFEKAVAALEETVSKAVADSGKKLEAVPHAVLGNPTDVILQRIVEDDVDLLVAGTHGRSGVQHMLLGSVAEHLGQHAPCDVLLVRQPVERPYADVVVGLKEKEAGLRVVERLVQIAPALGTRSVHAVAVYEPTSEWYGDEAHRAQVTERLKAGLREELEPCFARLGDSGLSIETTIERGHPARCLIAATQEGCDLLVLASHNRPRWTSVLLGDTSRALAHRAPCDVWLVREDREAHPIRKAILRDLGLAPT